MTEQLGLGAIIILLLVQLGIFSKKEDVGKVWTALAEFKALVAREYVHKDAMVEIKELIKELNHKIERLVEEQHLR